MSKFLVIVIGQNYLKPMKVIADIDVFLKRLVSESFNNTYFYGVYKLNEKYDVYVPMCSVHRGFIDNHFDIRYEGVSYNG